MDPTVFVQSLVAICAHLHTFDVFLKEFNSNSEVWSLSVFVTHYDVATGSLHSACQLKLVAIFPCSNGINLRKNVAAHKKVEENYG